MYNPFGGNKFPYSNFHELNLDWIIEIAKNFLDQYSHIQETIETGLSNMSDAEAQALANIAHDLAEALASIDQDLTSALSSINTTTDEATAAAIADINLNADEKLNDTLASIPDDYTELYYKIVNLTTDFAGLLSSLSAYKVKNYFNPAVLAEIEYNGNVCYSTGANGVTVQQNDSNAVTVNSSMMELDAGTYTVSTTNACRIQVFGNGEVIANVNPGTYVSFTISSRTKIYFKFIVSSTPYLIGNVQVERGNQATTYTPYDNPYFFNQTANYATGVYVTDRNAFLRFQSISEPVANEGTVTSGVVKYLDNTITNVGYHSSLAVSAAEMIYFSGYCYGDAFPVVIALYNNEVVGSFYHAQGFMEGNIIVPFGVDTIIINGNTENVVAGKIPNSSSSLLSLPAYIRKKTNNLEGKKIVWYGTSIPAGGYIGSEVSRNYPAFIADKYKCTIINEAVGGSCAHCKELNEINDANPYGFNKNYTLSSRCLTNTLTDMQWMIDHYNDSFWTNKPALTDQYKADMMQFSYGNRLDKYLNSNNFPDLFVFDHGYNDYVSAVDNYTGHEYEPYTLQAALNILFRRIYTYNPAAKILIIGNYKYQTRNGLVVQAQQAAAQRWDIPIFDTWKYTGLSDEQVYTTYNWVQDGNTWEQQPTTSHAETLTNVLLPDGVHPHSRPDNLIINRMADAIGNWLNLNAIFNR